VISAIRKHATKPLDVHLMIVDPDRYIKPFADCGADILTVHVEACTHLHRTIQAIHDAGMRAGVALNPHTPVTFIEDVINDIDLALIMSVNPGFGGQKFIERTYAKIHWLKEIIAENGSQCLVEIDGGVNADNAHKLVQSGADVLVAGNFVFGHSDPHAAIRSLREESTL